MSVGLMDEIEHITEQLVRMYPEAYEVTNTRLWAHTIYVEYRKCMHVLTRHTKNLGITIYEAGISNIATVHYYLKYERPYVSLRLIDMRHKHNKDSK